MVTEKQIRASFKLLHDELSEEYYSGEVVMSKAAFDALHGQNWADMDTVLIAAGFRTPVVPPRDLATELDELKGRVKKLEPIQ